MIRVKIAKRAHWRSSSCRMETLPAGDDLSGDCLQISPSAIRQRLPYVRGRACGDSPRMLRFYEWISWGKRRLSVYGKQMRRPAHVRTVRKCAGRTAAQSAAGGLSGSTEETTPGVSPPSFPGELWRPLNFGGLYGRAAKDCGIRAY